MPDPATIQRLRGLVLSATELKAMTQWPDALIEDYLNILDNIITLANLIDVEIDQLIEEISTNFPDGSIPFAEDGHLVEDNANFAWDIMNKILSALIISTDKINFNTSTTLTPSEGQMCWNADDGTLNLGLPGGNVVGQILQELLAPRSTASGSDIANGDLVYVSGAAGSNPEMSLAQADSNLTSSGTIAMATEDVIENQKGFFTAFGLVRDVNTASFTEGDQLYLSPTIPGGYVNVKPVPPYFIIKVGIVMRAHATEGVIFVTISQRTNNFEHIRGMIANSIPYADSDGFLTENNPGFTFDGTHLYLGADNAKIYIGLGNDYSTYYDGVNAIINPKELGSGILSVLGAIGIEELSVDPTNPVEGKAVFWKSDGAGTGDDGDLLYKEKSNSVISKGSLKWKDMPPSSIVLNTGTYISGDETDVQAMFDGNVYHVDEVPGAPGYDIEFHFTGVDRIPSFIVSRWIYDGSVTHFSTWDIWNYNTSAWDQLRMYQSSEAYYASMTMYIPRASNGDYVNGSGESIVRVYHHTSGNASHDIQIDYVGLTHSLQGVI